MLGLLVGVVTGLAVAPPADATTLTDVLDDIPRNNVRYCIPVGENPPGISLTQARALLDNAIAHWETPTAPGSGDAVNLSRGCGNPDVTIKSENIAPIAKVVATANEEIHFNENVSWWDGIGQRGTNEYSYEGVLVHEIGHTLGLGHVGDSRWTYDGNYVPTMMSCGSEADSAVMDSLQQHGWGSASYLAWGPTSSDSIWSANAGFESDFMHWARSSTSQITVGSAYADSGNRGVRMTNNGNWLYITHVYDPYKLTSDPPIEPDPFHQVISSMDDSNAELRVRTRYRHASGSTTGGVKVQYDTWYLSYDDSDFCKADTNIDIGLPSGITDLNTCGDQGTTWKKCGGGVEIDNSPTNTATVFRAYVQSTSSGDLYVDKAGSHGGTTP